MSIHTFVIVLVCGAALLALWIIARYTNFGPDSVVGALVHVLAAFLLLTLVLPPALDAVRSERHPRRHVGSGCSALPCRCSPTSS